MDQSKSEISKEAPVNKQIWLSALHDVFQNPPNLIVVESCPSTMDLAHSIIENENKEDYIFKSNSNFSACFSLTQTQGRGRISRKWVSEDNGGVYLSLVDLEPISIERMQGLSLVVGLAICNFIKSKNLTPKLKWPNDVYLTKYKAAGVLVETASVPGTNKKKLIIGVGLNLNQFSFDQEVPATSMSMVSGITYEYEKSTLQLTYELIKTITSFKKNGFSKFKNEWWSNSLMQNKQVENTEVGISGTAIGLSDYGALLVQTDKGISEIHSGDVGVVL